MNLVVDTSVWSLVLRRGNVDEENGWVRAFRKRMEDGDEVSLLGPILQELLDGLRRPEQFKRLQKILEPFPIEPLTREIYIQAAQLGNECRRRGVQAGPTDFLIAAACVEWNTPLLTADGDFSRIARHSALRLLGPG